jgi:two-component system alkaline phosphatase synthesis response regulator PhoP
MKTILIVEDDPQLLLGLEDSLELERYSTVTARDGEEAIRAAMRVKPDLVILDVMLPKLNGFAVCRRLRQMQLRMPVLMLTARAQEREKVLGLELGADDYVTKPFGVAELLARVKALLRRTEVAPERRGEFVCGDLRIDFQHEVAWRGARALPLTSLEFQLARYLIEKRGEPVSRQELLRDVWGYSTSTSTRTVDNVVAHLRKKLEAPGEPGHIITVHGIGYKFVG